MVFFESQSPLRLTNKKVQLTTPHRVKGNFPFGCPFLPNLSPQIPTTPSDNATLFDFGPSGSLQQKYFFANSSARGIPMGPSFLAGEILLINFFKMLN